jgi:hypothetical protein
MVSGQVRSLRSADVRRRNRGFAGHGPQAPALALTLRYGLSIRAQDSAARPSDTMMAAATEAHPERAVKPTSRSITSMWV